MYKKKIEQGRKVREKNNEEGVWEKKEEKSEMYWAGLWGLIG